MSEEQEPKQSNFPTNEEFQELSVEGKIRLFTGLPIPAQKLLIATNSLLYGVAPDASTTMAKNISKLTDAEFEEAKTFLSETPFFEVTDKGRFAVSAPMQGFINGDLRKFWQEQQRKDKRSK